MRHRRFLQTAGQPSRRSRVVREGVQLRHSRRVRPSFRAAACSCTPTLSSTGLVAPRPKADPQDAAHTDRGARVAAGKPGRPPARDDAGTDPDHRSPKQPKTGSPPPKQASSAPARATRTSRRRFAATGRHSATSPARSIGHQRLSAVTRNQIQDLVDRLVAQGLAPSTVRNAILPLRAIYRRALHRDEVAINPTLKLSLPAVRGRRDQIADPTDAAALLAALPESDRALWATALYAGLRRGELQALDLDRHRPRKPD